MLKELTTTPALELGQWPYDLESLTAIYQQLKARQQELSKCLAMVNDDLADKDDGSNGFLDDTMSKIPYTTDLANSLLKRQHEQQLQKLQRAEEKILQGKYRAHCFRCGKLISLERLNFLPETNLCSHCARKV